MVPELDSDGNGTWTGDSSDPSRDGVTRSPDLHRLVGTFRDVDVIDGESRQSPGTS